MASAPPPGAVDHLALTRARYEALGYPPYRWVTHDQDPPLARLPRPLARCRVVLLASGGVYRTGQVAFHHRDDTSYRRIPTDVAVADLRTSHFAYDQRDARADPNVVFPIEPLRRLAGEGVIGGLTSHALTFMGGIYSARRVGEELVPALRDEVLGLAADVALLVPV